MLFLNTEILENKGEGLLFLNKYRSKDINEQTKTTLLLYFLSISKGWGVVLCSTRHLEGNRQKLYLFKMCKALLAEIIKFCARRTTVTSKQIITVRLWRVNRAPCRDYDQNGEMFSYRGIRHVCNKFKISRILYCLYYYN